MTGRVLVLGSLNVDSTSYVETFPAPGETVVSRAFAVALGGKGTNQAVAAHLAGASVDLVARVGTDAAGAFALDTVRRVRSRRRRDRGDRRTRLPGSRRSRWPTAARTPSSCRPVPTRS